MNRLTGISILALALSAACDAGSSSMPGDPPEKSAREQGLPLDRIELPAGFAIQLYAADVPGARSMTLSPNGTLFVGSRREGNVYAVLDEDRDQRADRVLTIFEGGDQPNGVAFREGSLYVADISKVLRFDGIEESLENPPEPIVIRDDLPTDTHHGWKFIAFGPDDLLYVPVGFPCNICEPDDERYGTILRMKPDGSGLEIFAQGIRNTVGFPEEYRGQIFFAEHGSWNRTNKIGYRVMRAELEGDRAVSYEVFASGWLQGEEAWGRPVDVQVMPDGALLVSDDEASAIYRIAYEAS